MAARHRTRRPGPDRFHTDLGFYLKGNLRQDAKVLDGLDVYRTVKAVDDAYRLDASGAQEW
ncbi:MAG: hypothetical protein M0Z66_07940 [Thermaerobacter sp.]|nr:hypothetical protein [Thermaerobacter sp.]